MSPVRPLLASHSFDGVIIIDDTEMKNRCKHTKIVRPISVRFSKNIRRKNLTIKWNEIVWPRPHPHRIYKIVYKYEMKKCRKAIKFSLCLHFQSIVICCASQTWTGVAIKCNRCFFFVILFWFCVHFGSHDEEKFFSGSQTFVFNARAGQNYENKNFVQ